MLLALVEMLDGRGRECDSWTRVPEGSKMREWVSVEGIGLRSSSPSSNSRLLETNFVSESDAANPSLEFKSDVSSLLEADS